MSPLNPAARQRHPTYPSESMPMDVQIAESGPCHRTLTITIPPERIQNHVDQAYKAAGQQINLKGFRPGKVPRKMLEKHYGPQILSEAKEKLLSQAFNDACRENELVMVGQPELEGIDESPLDASKELSFTVKLDIRPEFELKEVKGLAVDRFPDAVTDEDIDAALVQLADQKKTLDSIDEEIIEGDFAKVNMTFKNEAGEVVHEKKDTQLSTNIPLAGANPEEFTSKLIGSAKGAKLSLDLTFPDNFDAEAVRGEKGLAEIEVLDVMRVQAAPIDDELAKGFEIESLDKLKEELQGRIGEEKKRNELGRQEGALFDLIKRDHPFDLPESLVEDQTQHMLKEFEERMKEGQVPEEEMAKKLEEAKPEAHNDAENRVRMFFILDAIARKYEIFVSDPEVDVELRNIAAHNSVDLETVQEHMEKTQGLADLRVGIMERKVREFLRENATITDKVD